MEYELYEILLLFSIYSILGWIADVLLFALAGQGFQNRGLCRGPYLMSFGLGALAVVYASQYIEENLPWNGVAALGAIFAAGLLAGLVLGLVSKGIVNGVSKRKLTMWKWYHPVLTGFGAVILVYHLNPLVTALAGRVHPFVLLAFLLLYWMRFVSDLVDGLANLRKPKEMHTF